eukprot:tig00000343_g24277.t1
MRSYAQKACSYRPTGGWTGAQGRPAAAGGHRGAPRSSQPAARPLEPPSASTRETPAQEADGVSADYAHLKLRIPKDYEVMLAGLTHTAQLGPEAPHVDAACRALADGLRPPARPTPARPPGLRLRACGRLRTKRLPALAHRAFGLPGPRAAPHGGRGPHHGPATP